MSTTEINWGYNCFTNDVYHGRPEAIWNLPLLQAVPMFSADELKELVITRIYNDAMMYVGTFSQKGTGATVQIPQEWAEKIKACAESRYRNACQRKVGELLRYYKSPEYRRDVEGVIMRVKENSLDPKYRPLHHHDSINMLCRIIAVSCQGRVQ